MWRANRLADALAKTAAKQRRLSSELLGRISALRDAHLHSASLLGWITHAANHFQATTADGKRW